VVGGFGLQLERRATPGLGPGPRGQVARQALLPALVQLLRRDLGLVGRHADQRQ
jgi:hypothetical protein